VTVVGFLTNQQLNSLYRSKKKKKINCESRRLRSVAGPVIHATGRSEFEDGLGSGDFVSDFSYHRSVRTRLPDITITMTVVKQH
jgi:hypothetical protein